MASAGELQQVDVLLREFKIKESDEDVALTASSKAKTDLEAAQAVVQSTSEALVAAKDAAQQALKSLRDFVDSLEA